ncbi:MAG: glycosyltransferase [Chromatiales bacterium]|nr:glycosyltransferase [Chromatiales bacterium]
MAIAQPDSENETIDVSILIKTFNEESHIGAAIESALNAIAPPLKGEVIIADSLSTDQTVEIAMSYPVAVVQLTKAEERCCGIGPQLGYQYSRGEFIYILDGDMELDPKFLLTAINLMRENIEIVGVAGIVEELGGDSYEFISRKEAENAWAIAGNYKWLDMGGLYRRSALERIGYLSNRNLHACEEQELGLRLFTAGDKLLRLPMRSVRHHGREESSWDLMKKRLASHYSDGPGELLHAAFGKPYLWQVLNSHFKLLVMAMLWLATVAGVGMLYVSPWPAAVVTLLYGLLFLLMTMRKHSLKLAALGMLNWFMRTLGFIRGLLTPQTPPTRWIDSQVITWPGRSSIEFSDRGGKFFRPRSKWATYRGSIREIGKARAKRTQI